MRILIATNAFKGTLGPVQAAEAIARALRGKAGVQASIFPVSDGGDGLIDALNFAPSRKIIGTVVPGPVMRSVKARWTLISKTAVIEMAEASGLKYLKGKDMDPLSATTLGVGRLMRLAVARGAHEIIVGLGGSASNDGGAGCAQGFGFKLMDKEGAPIPLGVQGLLKLRYIEPPDRDRDLKKIKLVGLSDVTNTLCGRLGSARVYGPQKGAGPKEVELIEQALLHYASVLKRELGVDVKKIKGGAAAGGLGAGLAAFFGAELRPGAAAVLERTGFEKALKSADLVITGEGRLDEQSFYGKAPIAVAELAKEHGVPVVVVCGSCDISDMRRLRSRGIGHVLALDRYFGLDRLLRYPARCLELGVRRGLALSPMFKC